MAGRVDGKVAFVTGGASGLGEAMVRLLVAEGAKVVIADVAAERGESLVAEIGANGTRAAFVHLDVTDEAAWERAMEQTLRCFGKLNVLVNNAGIAPPGDMEMPFAVWRSTLSVNLDGTFLGTRAAIRTITRSGVSGSIINVSSTMGMTAELTTAAYSASKAGGRNLTKAAAVHCATHKLPIRVNSIHPGMCLTPLVKSYLDAHPEMIESQIAAHPIGHLGEPEDIAYGVLYLASDESKFMLGSELVIDGGYLI
ncbi:glucose 1-dehydrogenase [Burkholderia cenocepacia]|uniref:glucose 1-dehydrogenase n=1 Tax=Burkholderia cenocepacia TaxID=95486 RepID=UPI001CF52758|nr:glucose 1-dehydrogenase [Burkholderia cenocepacia]MCA8010210.1 glucose 1-dehydrogenase [Burkholderia cenocepacia]